MAAMNAAQRRELLRARFKAHPVTKAKIGAGLANAAGKGAVWPRRVRYVVLPKPAGRGYVSLGAMQSRTPPQWVRAADHAEATASKVKKRREKHALTRIAERYASPDYRAETKGWIYGKLNAKHHTHA